MKTGEPANGHSAPPSGVHARQPTSSSEPGSALGGIGASRAAIAFPLAAAVPANEASSMAPIRLAVARRRIVVPPGAGLVNPDTPPGGGLVPASAQRLVVDEARRPEADSE